jgi:hypothetical protein
MKLRLFEDGEYVLFDEWMSGIIDILVVFSGVEIP